MSRQRTPTGFRNRALIAILYRGGLRINEALDLFPKDIDLDAGSIRVLNGKGGRARILGIDPAAGAFVERWLEVRSELGMNGTCPVVCTLAGGRMGDACARVLLPRLGHRSIATTARHLDHIPPRQVIEAMQRRNWRPEGAWKRDRLSEPERSFTAPFRWGHHSFRSARPIVGGPAVTVAADHSGPIAQNKSDYQ